MGTIIITEDARVLIVEQEPAIKVETGKHYRVTKDCYQSLPNERTKFLAKQGEIVTCMYVISEEKGWERSMFRTDLGTSVLWHKDLKPF